MAAHSAELKYVCALIFPLMNLQHTLLITAFLTQLNTSVSATHCLLSPFTGYSCTLWTSINFTFSVVKKRIFLDCVLVMHQINWDYLATRLKPKCSFRFPVWLYVWYLNCIYLKHFFTFFWRPPDVLLQVVMDQDTLLETMLPIEGVLMNNITTCTFGFSVKLWKYQTAHVET